MCLRAFTDKFGYEVQLFFGRKSLEGWDALRDAMVWDADSGKDPIARLQGLFPKITRGVLAARSACKRPWCAPLPLGLDRAGREGLERPRLPNIAPRGRQIAQDGLEDGSRKPKRTQYSLRHASKRPQGLSKTAPSGRGASQGRLVLPSPKDKDMSKTKAAG